MNEQTLLTCMYHTVQDKKDFFTHKNDVSS